MMNRRDFLKVLASGVASIALGGMVKDLGNGFGEIVDEPTTHVGEITQATVDINSVGWKWYGGYGKMSENWIVRAEAG